MLVLHAGHRQYWLNIIRNNSTFIDDPKPGETKFLKGTENLDDDFDENHHFDNNEAEGTNLSSDKLMKTLELDSKILKEVAINGFVSHFVCKEYGYQSARKWGSEETFSCKAQNRAIKLSGIFCKNSSNLNLACIIEMKVKNVF